jgi:hypothetical protein
MQRLGKHTSVSIKELLGKGEFYVVRAKDSLKQRVNPVWRRGRIPPP